MFRFAAAAARDLSSYHSLSVVGIQQEQEKKEEKYSLNGSEQQ